MAKPSKKPKKENTYQPPKNPLPPGTIIEDVLQRKWKLGPTFAKGGCGDIYLAQDYPTSNQDHYPYVMKIEYRDNSPLFCEMHFYRKHAQREEIEDYKRAKKLTSFGVSPFISAGVHFYNNEEYRFLIMDRLGSNIEKIFNDNNRRFRTEVVFQIAIQILDVLEYVHSKDYIHGDVKGSNILLEKISERNNQVYLVDFGLIQLCSSTEQPDPKCAHDGTKEYVSRDGHLGIKSKRGDLESLGYNLIHWLGYILPWEKDLSSHKTIQKSKEKYLSNLTEFFETCFGNENPPDALVQYMDYVTKLKFSVTPNYRMLRNIFITAIKDSGGYLGSEFKFEAEDTSVKRKSEDNQNSVKMKKVSNTSGSKGGIPISKEVSTRKNLKKIEVKKAVENISSSERTLRPRRVIKYF